MGKPTRSEPEAAGAHGRPVRSRLRPRAALLWLVAVVLVATIPPVAWGRATATRTFSVYAVPLNEVYINNTDSLSLGVANNPFGKPTGSAASAAKESTDGPFLGDVGLYSFAVYADRGLTRRIGSALYTCQYYFDRNGFCDTNYELTGGTLIGAGIFNFGAHSFAIAITGGQGAYASSSGDVEASASGPQSQRLSFTLTQS
jgi:hypothetical protein